LRQHASAIPGPVDFRWIESADHGFRPLKASGLTTEIALRDAAAAVVAWVTALP
jgi:predicted alpha/beta-hydrolase family hydrolase